MREITKRNSAPSLRSNRTHNMARQRDHANPQRGLVLKSGDVTVRGNTMEECRELADMAKDISKNQPPKLKLLGITLSAGSMENIYKLAGISATGFAVWVCFKEYSKRKDHERRIASTNTNPSQTPTNTPPMKSETLNSIIGRQQSNMPGSKDLCGKYVRRGGINLIFSPTGEGKSILAMQMGIEIASGQPTKLVKDAEQPRQPITTLVYDGEQDDEDIWERYGQKGHVFPERLQRVKGYWYDDENKLLKDIEKQVENSDTELCIVIDNITSIIPALSGNKTRKFYGELKKILTTAKDEGHRVTFIIVAHTIKGYDENITLKDLAGSANLSNFNNQCIAIIPTNLGEKIKMLKVVKDREKVKGDATVIKMVDDPYLHFEYVSTNPIKDAVTSETLKDVENFLNVGSLLEYSHGGNGNLAKDKLREKVFALKKKGFTGKAIAQQLGVNEMTVSRILHPKDKHKNKKSHH